MKNYRLKKLNSRTWEVFDLSGLFIGIIVKEEKSDRTMWSIGDHISYKDKKIAAEKLLSR